MKTYRERIGELDFITPSVIAEETMQKRHYRDDEVFLDMCNRIAHAIGKYTDEETVATYYTMMSRGLFLPSSPYMANAGITNSNMSCFVIPIEDSLDGIYGAVNNSAKIQSGYGGVGMDLSPIRYKDCPVTSMKRGGASGPIAFASIFNESNSAIYQGGARSGAGMFTIRVDHPDIEEFITCKDVDGVLSNFNTSVAVTDEFMQAVEEDDGFELVFDGKVVRTVEARYLWNLICEQAHKTGEPGLLFIDEINKHNPNKKSLGLIKSSNPCQPEFATVLTPFGIRQFKDIDVGDEIWSGEKWTKIIRKESTGIKEVYKYATTRGHFIGTENHNIFSQGVKTEVGKAKAIDSCNGCEIDNRIVIGYFEECILDGLLIGDGTRHKCNNDAIYLNIGKKDHDYFKSSISYLIGDSYGGSDRKYNVTTGLDSKYLPHTYLRTIPDKYRFGSISSKLSFLRGLYSANGSVLKTGSTTRISLKQTSHLLVLQVQEMLSSVGIESYYTINKAKVNRFANGDFECKESYDLSITRDRKLFHDYIGFIQEYKMEKLLKGLDVRGNKNSVTSEIKYAKSLGKHEVFSITVEDEKHRYWSGGVLTANCGEAALLDNTACNLGSIVLSRHLTKDKEVDWELLRFTVNNAIEFLDNAYDVNEYPLDVIKTESLKGRKLGLGVMGWADMLSEMGIRYGSSESIELAKEVMGFINKAAWEMSEHLAVLNGRNIYLDDPRDVRKNSSCTSIAPNGTVGTIAGVNGGIEPYFALAYQRKVTNKDGTVSDYDVVVPAFEKEFGKMDIYQDILEAVKNNKGGLPIRVKDYVFSLYQRDMFITAGEVSPREHVEMLAAFQQNVDMAVSKTINLPRDASIEDVKEAYELAYNLKVKGLTVYRDGSRDKQVLSVESKPEVKQVEAMSPDSWAYKSKEERPMVLDGKTYFIRTTNGKYYITINGENGIPLEIFASPHSKDVESNVDAEALCRMISLALRSRIPLEAICSQLEKVRLQSLVSMPHNVKKCLEMYSAASQASKEDVVMYETCPECKENTLIRECGCCKCLSCGFSSCG